MPDRVDLREANSQVSGHEVVSIFGGPLVTDRVSSGYLRVGRFPEGDQPGPDAQLQSDMFEKIHP